MTGNVPMSTLYFLTVFLSFFLVVALVLVPTFVFSAVVVNTESIPQRVQNIIFIPRGFNTESIPQNSVIQRHSIRENFILQNSISSSQNSFLTSIIPTKSAGSHANSSIPKTDKRINNILRIEIVSY